MISAIFVVYYSIWLLTGALTLPVYTGTNKQAQTDSFQEVSDKTAST